MNRPLSTDQPAGAADREPSEPAAHRAPGDEAPPGSPGTGENVCPDCGGSGRRGEASCPTCEGRGVVTTGIGGA